VAALAALKAGAGDENTAQFLGDLALLDGDNGFLAEARPILRRARALAEKYKDPERIAVLDRIEGDVAEKAGDLRGPERHFRAAVDGFDRLGKTPDHRAASALLGLGRTLVALHRRRRRWRRSSARRRSSIRRRPGPRRARCCQR
jgi:hypothetical protein